MHGILVNRLGGLSLPRKSVVRLTDRPDMILDVYRGRKTTKQQQHHCHLKVNGNVFRGNNLHFPPFSTEVIGSQLGVKHCPPPPPLVKMVENKLIRQQSAVFCALIDFDSTIGAS